jgi:hypothetical protein
MLWSTVNEIMGWKAKLTPSFIQSDGSHYDVANYFNEYFIGKV